MDWILLIVLCFSACDLSHDPYIIIEYTVSEGSKEAAIELKSFVKCYGLKPQAIRMNDVVIETDGTQLKVIHKDKTLMIPIKSAEQPLKIVSIEGTNFVDVDSPFFGTTKRTLTGNVKCLVVKVKY